MDSKNFWQVHLFSEKPDPLVARLFGRKEDALKWMAEKFKEQGELYNATLWHGVHRAFNIFYRNAQGQILEVNTLYFLSREQAAKLSIGEDGRVNGVPARWGLDDTTNSR